MFQTNFTSFKRNWIVFHHKKKYASALVNRRVVRGLIVVVPVFLHLPDNNTDICRGTEKLRYLEGGSYDITSETEKIRNKDV